MITYLVTYRYRKCTASKEFNDLEQAKIFCYIHSGFLYELHYDNGVLINCKSL